MSSSAPNTPLWQALFALSDAITYALSGEEIEARECIQSAYVSMIGVNGDVHLPLPSAAPENTRGEFRGGLAPWQIRRLKTHIDAHLAASILCEDLAQQVCLSLSHFMRAFRESFGCPPHMYLMRRRIERAQGLMLTTVASLGQIALECGLTDQSHLSRLFQRFIGESPAAWRRARVSGLL